MKSIILLLISSIISISASAGTLTYDSTQSKKFAIKYVEVIPNNNGRFTVYFSADNKRFLIIDSEGKPVEFGYADASGLRKDILKKTTLGSDAGINIGCASWSPRINGVISGCQLLTVH